jgi:hypothetical protein
VQARTSGTIWKLGSQGEGSQPVLRGLLSGYPGAWAAARNGIYYLGEDHDHRPYLFFFEQATGRSLPVVAFPGPLAPLEMVDFSLSPDERDLLTVLRESSSSDLLALSDFR